MRELHKGEDESKTLAENNWSFKVTLLVSHIRGLWGGGPNVLLANVAQWQVKVVRAVWKNIDLKLKYT